MANRKKPDNDNPPPANRKVGYKKPPKGRPYRPGESGNPSGRPKKIPTFFEGVSVEMDRDFKLEREDGPPILTTKHELAIRNFTNALARGDLKALQYWHAHQEKKAGAASPPTKGYNDNGESDDDEFDIGAPLTKAEFAAFSIAVSLMELDLRRVGIDLDKLFGGTGYGF